MNDVHLHAVRHPDADAQAVFDSLIGIDQHKADLVDELVALLAPDRMERWLKRHHDGALPLATRWAHATPLVLLAGEVGCGKTALASAVATPVAKEIDRRVVVLETPSDLRGGGHVGELSARITSAFEQARREAKKVGAGLLVIDEADDVATSRAQNQAHHEDRAGLNVLIKQIDQVARAKDPLAVILITNRHAVLDPAVRRRTTLQLDFKRPDAAARRAVFESLLEGVAADARAVDELLHASSGDGVPYSYSDLVIRLGRLVLRRAQADDVPVSPSLMLACLQELTPSPLIEDGP